ncbi:MAG: type IV pilin N-terminal domain-containing protein [Candidatus Poseidoniia archaeon]|nr:type IV pilin N-terminal domain-containing protein [Candidatus Poseidoniia archaeon]
MEHRIEQDNEGVSPVIAVILMVAITVVLAAVLYVWAASFLEQGDTSPFAQFTSTKNSSGDYYVTVVKVSTKYDLEAFSYFLKDSTGTTNEFGEIAMQNLSGDVVGIDISYGDKCGDVCDGDLLTRAAAVDDDDGSNYTLEFRDNDQDGNLSSGDQFSVRGQGPSTSGPAKEDWSICVKYDLTGYIIGCNRLG